MQEHNLGLCKEKINQYLIGRDMNDGSEKSDQAFHWSATGGGQCGLAP